MNQEELFTVRRWRKHRVEVPLFCAFSAVLLLTGCQGTGVSASPSATSQAQPPEPVRHVVVVGDSLSTGLGTSAKDAWPSLINDSPLAKSMNVEISNESQNSSGFLSVGSKNSTFITQTEEGVTQDTSMVLFFGSENDRDQDLQELESAVGETLAIAKQKAPNAKLVMVGPPAYITNPEPNRLAVRDALKNAAQGAAVEFVDPIAEGWIFNDVDRLVGPDGVHPSVEGQQDLQEKMRGLIISALGEQSTDLGG